MSVPIPVGGSESPPARMNKMEKRAAVSGTAGSALEFFDFAIYGALAASLFPDLFFSNLGTPARCSRPSRHSGSASSPAPSVRSSSVTSVTASAGARCCTSPWR